jgi:hypothetical protein
MRASFGEKKALLLDMDRKRLSTISSFKQTIVVELS